MKRYCLPFVMTSVCFASTAVAQEAAENSTSVAVSTDDAGGNATDDDFDAKHLFVGAQLIGNLTIQSLDSSKGRLGGGASGLVEYVVIPYFKVGLEPGYNTASYNNEQVTASGSNVVDDDLNLYVDPEDLITKRGGRGTVSQDSVILPLVLKGRYPISVGSKGMFLAPFLSLGAQAEFNTSSSYAVQNDDTFEFQEGLNGFDFKLLGGLGLEFSLGKAGQIGLEGRYLFAVTEAAEYQLLLNSRPNAETDSDYPIKFTVPENRWSRVQLLLGYRYGFDLGG